MHVEAQRIEYWEFEIAKLKDEITNRERKGKKTEKQYKELRIAKQNLKNAMEELQR